MARDYFSDIQDDSEKEKRTDRFTDPSSSEPVQPAPERSIRNVSIPIRRQSAPRRIGATDMRVDRTPPQSSNYATPTHPPSRSRARRFVIWGAAGAAVIVLSVAAFLFFWADTKVVITPRTHQVTFDPTTQFTAYPQDSASAGAIVYSVQTNTFEDAETVPATGTEKAQDRASGSVTVFNEYSTAPVRLIKNTRFESPNGLIYRIPASVEVPGMKGPVAGQITITVFADQAGPDYNIGPTARFTLPGLKSSADMYAKVYARSTEAFSGGFIGDKPAVAPQALEAARAQIRSRLAEKARLATAAVSNGFAFPDLVRISYESLPTTPDPAGGARVNEKAIVQIPVFPQSNFASSLARAVSADAADSPVRLLPRAGFVAKPVGDITESLGSSPLVFTLDGSALIVWDVDTGAVAGALAGREQGAFETIIGTFPSVEKAQANIAPFWSSSFPETAADIAVEVVEPQP